MSIYDRLNKVKKLAEDDDRQKKNTELAQAASTGTGTRNASSSTALSGANTALIRSGQSRDSFDAAVRANYAVAQKTGAPVLTSGYGGGGGRGGMTQEEAKVGAEAAKGTKFYGTAGVFSAPKLVAGTLVKGVDQAMSGLTSSAEWLIGQNITGAGKLLGQDWSNNPVSALNNRIQQAKETNQEYFQGNVEAVGKAAKAVDQYGTMVAAAVPQALLALGTAGGSSAEAGLQAAAKSGGILSTLASATKSMAKDPQYWLSFLQVAGDSYNQAKADGADDTKANLYAMSNGLLNALVEVGGTTGHGGIQSLPEQMRKGGSTLKSWISTMVDEGKEEVVQGIIERGLQNVVYGKENPVASVTDSNAVLNPKTAAQEFAGGALVGGILGGGQILGNHAINTASNNIMPRLKTAGELGLTQNTENENAASGAAAAVNPEEGGEPLKTINSNSHSEQTLQKKTGDNNQPTKYDIIPKLDENANQQQPKKQTLDEYLGERGLSSPISDFMLDKLKNPHGMTQRQLNKLQADAEKAATEYAAARSQAVNEYNQQVKDGKIIDKTNVERMIETAHGFEENQSTQAARRALNKRGIDWETGERISETKSPDTVSDRSVEEPQNTVTGTELSTKTVLQPEIKSKGNLPMGTDITPRLETVEQKNLREDKSLPGGDSVTAEDDGYLDALVSDENAPGEHMTPADYARSAKEDRLKKLEPPPEKKREAVSQEDLDDLWKLWEDQASPTMTDSEARRKEALESADNLVSDQSKQKKPTIGESAENARSYFVRKMVDAGDSVKKVQEMVNDQYLYPFYNMARASASAGVNMISEEQTDIQGKRVGSSLSDIFNPVREKGTDYYNVFQQYLYHLHNIDRMSIVNSENSTAKLEAEAALADFDKEHPDIATVTEARLKRKAEGIDEEGELAKERLILLKKVNQADQLGNKPVFDYTVTADMSKDTAARLLREHPEFAKYQKQVREYIKNLMQYRVDSGLMTQDDADFLEKYYTNYVPTYRITEQENARTNRKSVRIGKTVGRAQGGTEKLMPLHEALGKQTMQAVREGSKNRFGQRLLENWENYPKDMRKYISDAQKYDAGFSADTFDSLEENQITQKNNTFSVYKDGKLWEMAVDPSMFDAVKALSPDAQEVSVPVKLTRGANSLFKKLVTGYNPMFTVRNVARDLQTAGLYSRDFTAFTKNYPLALKEIASDGAFWKQYKALGGVYSSVFDYQTGTVKESSAAVKKTLGRVEALNMAMEQAPRLAEFMSIVKKGDGSMENLMDAMHAAADVTVNFGRSGTVGKMLNANFVPFLNPGIQGFDRMVRRVTETKGAKEWAKLAVRAAALGVAPTLLNGLLYRDDKDWDDLRDSDKDTNYLFKIGDGLWLKVPKGRELSVLGMTGQRISDLIKGKDVNWEDFIATVGNQVAPANPLKTNIVSAAVDSDLFDKNSPGKTWYGGDIESQRLQNYEPGKRYDSSTDIFSQWLGGQLNLSPKKINYILDQYSGVVGDFVLPLLTPQAERDPFTKAFTVDSVSNNHISEDFYNKGDEITYDKSGGDVSMQAVSRFWNKQVSACGDIYTKIRETENSTALTDAQKRDQVRQAKAVLNGIQKNALATVETYQKSVKKHLTGTSADAVDQAYLEANKECFGAEYALQTYNKDVYAKAQEANQNGVNYPDYYDYYFATKDFQTTKTKSENTQKMEYLQSSGMSDSTKAEIYYADLANDSDLIKQAELEKSSGISGVQYWRYKLSTDGISADKDSNGKTVSGSKKAKILKAIDKMNLTRDQKTALYYAAGYQKSTLDEAPWYYYIEPKLKKLS